jgi:phytoene synthase
MTSARSASTPIRAAGLARARVASDATPAAATASGSSFYAAMRLLPREQRQAMFAIYDFCRRVDDVADGRGDRAARLAALAQWRAGVDALFRGVPPTHLARLATAVERFGLPREPFHAIVDGMEMDAREDIVAPDLLTLDLYCDRVASAVGRLSVRVFGMPPPDGDDLAFHLGRALQFTNILRDIDEDGARGRVYLPRQALRAAGIESAEASTILAHPALGLACAAVADLARGHFACANRILARHPLRVVRAPTLMARVYETIFERLVARGFAAPRRPVRAKRRTLVWTVVRYGLIASRAGAASGARR